MGYQNGFDKYRYCDPIRIEYMAIKHYGGYPVARKFNETFSVASFYQPNFVGHYENAVVLGPVVSVIKIIFFLIGAIPLYLVLVLLAKEFGKQSTPSIEITHQLIGNNFQEITKISPLIAIIALVILIVIMTVVSILLSNSITDEHTTKYSSYSSDYREKIMRAVSPCKIVKGRIMRVDESIIKHYDDRFQYDDTDVKNRRIEYVPTKIYTIEFSNILHIPIYLGFELVNSGDSEKIISKLDLLASDKDNAVLFKEKEIAFVVKEDYSISLVE